MILILNKKKETINTFSHIGAFQKPSMPTTSCYHRKSRNNYSSLDEAQKEHRMDK